MIIKIYDGGTVEKYFVPDNYVELLSTHSFYEIVQMLKIEKEQELKEKQENSRR